MNILISLGQIALALIALLLVLGIITVLSEVQKYMYLKTLEKRRAIMLELLEEEIVSLRNTQAGKFGASDVVTNINRRMEIKHFTTIDLQHMAETTIKSLQLKGII